MNRGQVEGLVNERCVAFLIEARALTGDPDKPSLPPCIGWAVRRLGGTTANVETVTDTEVEVIPSAKADALLDLAEYRTLLSVQTNLTAVSGTAGPVRDEWNDLSARLEKILAQKRLAIAADHGILLESFGSELRRAKLRRA